MTWTKKDLISVKTLETEEINTLFALTKRFKENSKAIDNSSLKNKTLISAFLEPSTRTQLSFDQASRHLGVNISYFGTKTSSLAKKESIADTARTFEALQFSGIILRTTENESTYGGTIAKESSLSVINAGNGKQEHPTQALLDAFSLEEAFGSSLEGKKITISGDIQFSRVAQSNIALLKKLGADITLASCKELLGAIPKGIRIKDSLKSALKDADAVMLLRLQKERGSEKVISEASYRERFGLHTKNADDLRENTKILHSGPMNTGVEIDEIFADSKNSLILKQVNNGVYLRTAVLKLCLEANRSK